jgi:hypothetical protein
LTLREASELAAAASCAMVGGQLLHDGWPGFSTADGWRYRVAKGGMLWVALNHELCKTGRGLSPDQAREQALVREFS